MRIFATPPKKCSITLELYAQCKEILLKRLNSQEKMPVTLSGMKKLPPVYSIWA